MIAEETGGIAVVNQNDFDKALKRIDAETSDYYVLGYYSKQSGSARKRRRQIEVKVKRPSVNVVVPQGVRRSSRSPPPASSSRRSSSVEPVVELRRIRARLSDPALACIASPRPRRQFAATAARVSASTASSR